MSGEREWRHTFGSWDFDDYGPAANTPVVADGKMFTATYPMGSTLDWMYTEYGDFHVLRSVDNPDDGATTTSEGTTGKTTATESTTTTRLSGTGEASTTGLASETGTTVTATDGQSGFRILTAVGGVADVGAYLRSRIDGSD
nr:hypothetical protein [Haladaptatus halobius]